MQPRASTINERPFYAKARHFLEWRKRRDEQDIEDIHQHIDSVWFEEDEEDITTILRIEQNG